MRSFAEAWVDAWNRRDVEAVLSHYVEDLEFTSPKAAVIAGRGALRGKEALRAYWTAALERIPSLRFDLDRAIWDGEARELVVMYAADLNGQRSRACEVMSFDAEGRVVRGEALYGAPLAP